MLANPSIEDALIAAARTVRQRAYAPYSKFQVGAALLTTEGEIFTGCNVENSSYGLTQCAERAALTAAVAAGRTQYAQMAIVSSGGVWPCGACRQVLAEFCSDLTILLVDAEQPSKIVFANLRELLPGVFRLNPLHPPTS